MRGLAGQRDPKEAKVWLERAKRLGVTEAETDLARLAGEPAGMLEPRAASA
jgi:TPR repeat protein